MESAVDFQRKLDTILRHYGALAVAVSGGMDSTFLAFCAKKILGEKMRAISVRSAFSIESELKMFSDFARRHNINHSIIDVEILNNQDVIRNGADRCYHCKKAMFKYIVECAARHGFDIVADGSNISDMEDYRPGMKALEELGVISPLKAAGFMKSDIIHAIRSQGIDIPIAHPNSCLATRIAYGTQINERLLDMIREAEKVLLELGVSLVRVRYHTAIARIEMPLEYVQKIIIDKEKLKAIIASFKELGFQYVTFDLEGYRKGSMNVSLESS